MYIDVRGSFYWVCFYWSSYASFLRPSILCIHFVVYFESEMSDFLLGVLGHWLFHHYVHCWCGFPSYLIWADHHYFSCSAFHHYPHFCFRFIIFILPFVPSLQRPIPSLVLPLHHHYTSQYQFDFLHCLIIIIIATLGILRSMAHEIFYTCCILYMRAWVFDHWVFGPSFPSFLSPYHPSLHYVLCFKTTLRPWDQISSSTNPSLIGAWDLIDIWISSCFFF